MTDANDTDWSLLYEALVAGLDLNPKTFQLVYPFMSWSWPAASDGYTPAAQIDFCATMPQWSAVGRYTSSGQRFDNAYGNFLSVLAPAADPALEQEIAAQQQRVQLARDDYEAAYAAAEKAYAEETGGNNVPTFTEWLSTAAAEVWYAELEHRYAAYESEVAILDELIAQTGDPGLTQAIADYGDPAYTTRYEGANLSSFPAVPAYTVPISAAQWVEKVRAGDSDPAAITFSQPAPAYDYGLTWAAGSQPVAEWFWATAEDQTWQPLPQDDLAYETVTIDLPAWKRIDITCEGWFEAAFVRQRADGPFMTGYSGYPDGGGAYMWGEGGVMSLMKTGFLVAYEPSFVITASGESMTDLTSRLASATALRIGPFVFGDAEATTPLAFNAEDGTLTGASTSPVPVIFGVEVGVLPTI